MAPRSPLSYSRAPPAARGADGVARGCITDSSRPLPSGRGSVFTANTRRAKPSRDRQGAVGGPDPRKSPDRLISTCAGVPYAGKMRVAVWVLLLLAELAAQTH